jgi:acyl-CoA dehydrogenase
MARAAVPLLLTPEQELIKQVVREFAEKELAPEATAIDREARFPKDHYAKMAPLGLLGMFLPADQGGSGTDTLSFTVAVEEVARGSGTDAALLILQNTVVTHLLSRTVDAAQRDAYLGPSVAGARIGATALTEESGGSSLEDVLTTATERPEGYVLRGSKAFVACAGVADYYIVLARAREGPTLFLVDASAPGLHFSEPESKLGLRGLPLAEMYLNRVAVPASARLGEAGQAMATLEEPLMLARLAVAAGLGGRESGDKECNTSAA